MNKTLGYMSRLESRSKMYVRTYYFVTERDLIETVQMLKNSSYLEMHLIYLNDKNVERESRSRDTCHHCAEVPTYVRQVEQ